MELNIISDVAGEYNALIRLSKKMPKASFLGVGDLVDRGPNSAEVVQWFIDNGDSLRGNHEEMMLDFILKTKIFDQGDWTNNGGGWTLNSYGWQEDGKLNVPKSHLEWLITRKRIFESDDLIVTHAPIGRFKVEDLEFTWNREIPNKKEKFQVFGHNSHWGIRWFKENEDPWAVCLDDSRKQLLTGMHWPSKEIFQEPYEIKKEIIKMEINQ